MRLIVAKVKNIFGSVKSLISIFMKKWKIEMELWVDQIWIEDGFDLQDRYEDIKEAMTDLLPWAIPGEEVKVKNLRIDEKTT
jgi:hypothetical protein